MSRTMATDEERKQFVDRASEYLIWGDLDKPFHRPECECSACEQWRTDNNRPTHGELRCKKPSS